VLNEGDLVTAEMLPRYLWTAAKLAPPPVSPELRANAPISIASPASFADIKPLEDVIRRTIVEAIDVCSGSIPRAAAALQVSPSTIYRRMEAWREAEAK
jgi:two-component system repressor protein LuxO